MRARAFLAAGCAVVLALPAAAREAPSAVDRDTLMRHVRHLASPALAGRGTWADREKTSRYIAEHFSRAGLQPLPGAKDASPTMFHDQVGVKTPTLRNVAAWLPAAEPEGEYVIVSAHYDHLGTRTIERKTGDATVRTTITFRGADDNATGVAALLELARLLAAEATANPQRFRRSIVFVAFDLEERLHLGSNHWVAHPPVALPLARCAAFVTLDMLGRSLADLVPGSLFCMGTESAAELEAIVRATPDPAGGRKLVLGVDFNPGYSDYVPFQRAKVPFLFFTGGASTDYHKPTDTPERLEVDHFHARARWIHAVLPRIVNLDARPTWRDEAEPTLAEMQALRHVIGAAKDRLPKMQGVPPAAALMVGNFAGFLDRMMSDGAITKQERTNARNSALMLFKLATQGSR